MKYTDNNITFNNVKETSKFANIVSSARFGGSEYDYDANDNPIAPKYLINAIDIDWNGASLNDGTTINTSGDLLKYIQDLGSSEGIQGPQGITGIAGHKGDDGAQGPKGITGIQGNGIQFIFTRTASNTAPMIYNKIDASATPAPGGQAFSIDENGVIEWWESDYNQEDDDWETTYTRTDDDYLPPSFWNSTDKKLSTNWRNEPFSLDTDHPFGWVSVRTKLNGNWQPFGDAKLYAHYDENGASTDTDWNYSFSDGTTVNSKEDLLAFVDMLAGLVAALYAQLQLVDNN